MPDHARFPEFERPPVVETVMAVRFRELPEFTSARIGQFWERYLVSDLPQTEDKPPYGAPVERFGAAGEIVELQLKLSEVPPPTRAWFIGDNNIIQLQSDWFAYNWRRTDEQPDYIRYSEGRGRFEGWFGTLDRFIREELKRPLVPVQCEITYVNVIELTEEDLAEGPLGDAVRGARPAAGGFLPVPEGAQVAWSYVMPSDGKAIGRLHLTANTVEERTTSSRAVRLVLTARGRPSDESLAATLGFFDLGHEWIVRGFKDVTTERMWDRWVLIEEDNAVS